MQPSNSREGKQLDSSLEALIQRVQEYKASISSLLMKLEHEHHTIQWPTMLDSFALLSGQLNSLNSLLKSDRMTLLRNQILLPLLLNPEKDQELEKLTEGRVLAFNHEIVPDYLRTKPEPEVEEQSNILANRANHTNSEVIQKQVNTLNKLVNNVLDTIQTHNEQRETEMNQKFVPPQTSSQADTMQLIAAISGGKGLKRDEPPSVVGPGRPGGVAGVRITGAVQQPNMGYQQQNSTFYGNQPGGTPQQQQQINKAPTSIKTNIRAAHPYMRQ